MKLQLPKVLTFWIAVILGVLGLLGVLIPTLPLISAYAFWLVFIGLVLLIAGLTTNGL